MKVYKAKEVEKEMKCIIDSATITVGDALKLDTGGVDAADAAADPVYGLCEGLVTPGGVPLNQALSTEIDGATYTDSTKTVSVDSDNESDELLQAQVRYLHPADTVSAELDATIGTTTGSNIPGYYISVSSSDSTLLDENTVHASNRLQFRLVDNGQGDNSCVDPVLGGNFVLCKVVEQDLPRGEQA